jgi:BolA protein
MNQTATRIETTLRAALEARHLELVNESHMHAGPATESHYKLVLVSPDFAGKSRVQRHQSVYRLLQDELQSAGRGGSVHALALHLYTPEEWQAAAVPASPLCAGAKARQAAS